MKKSLLILLAALFLTGCSRVSLHSTASGEVTYTYGEVSFTESLTDDEVKSVVQILDGKQQSSGDVFGVPACGFSEEISITIDGTTFALACDDCGVVKNCGNGHYITISEEERDTLEAIFTSRGGKFPCV